MTKSAAELFSSVLKNKKNPRIKLIGDSITHGVGGTGWEQKGEVIVKGWAESPDGYCWANLLRDYMKEKYNATVINKACTGTNVEFVMNNFPSLVSDEDDIIVCTIGTNNRHKYFDQGEKPEREDFLRELYVNITKMYGMFKKTGIPTVFVANIPASEKNEQDGENYWCILHMTDINDSYKKLCREYDATVVSLYDLFSDYCSENGVSLDSLLCDGLHPNDEGYRVMFELLVGAFEI